MVERGNTSLEDLWMGSKDETEDALLIGERGFMEKASHAVQLSTYLAKLGMPVVYAMPRGLSEYEALQKNKISAKKELKRSPSGYLGPGASKRVVEMAEVDEDDNHACLEGQAAVLS